MFFRRICALSVLVALAAGMSPNGAARADTKPDGVVGDGVADDTAAIQAALDKAGQTGGQVALGPGQFLIKGSLTVPTGVTLQGVWEAPHHGVWNKGTSLLVTGGRGEEDGTAAITLTPSSALRGVTMIWPEETADNIVPYPWAVHGVGMHNTVENVTLVNAYQGIKIGQPSSELHLIRNVFGCVLRRGVFIDSTSDIGRIENVHFNMHYWMRSGYPSILPPGDDSIGNKVVAFAQKNLEAFIFGRSDWEYVANTFVWGAHIGYRFIKTKDGATNGQFMGIGADDCSVGLLVDSIQSIGIQVTNGEFTAFAGGANAGIVISPTASGGAQFVNCNFWATPGGAVQVHGDAQVVLNACRFAEGASPAVVIADKGHLVVNNCSFGASGKAVLLLPGVRSAVIASNLQAGGLIVDNKIGASAQIGLNEVPYVYPADVIGHYRVRVGSAGDETFLGAGWYGDEDENESGNPVRAMFNTARWTNGEATMRLPVIAGSAYTLTVWLLTRPGTPPATISVAGARAAIAVGKNQKIVLNIPAAATRGLHTIDVKLAGKPWQPSVVIPGSNDSRKLGVRVLGIEMRSAKGPAPIKAIN